MYRELAEFYRQKKAKLLGENPAPAHFCLSQNFTMIEPGSISGRRGKRQVTDCLTHASDKSCPHLRTIFVSEILTLSLSGDVVIKYTAFCNLTKKSDGQTYLLPFDYELMMDPKTGTFYFGNMFNGNKLLGEIHGLQFINTAVNVV